MLTISEINEHRKSVYYLIWTITKNERLAEELTQDTIIRAYYNREKYDPSKGKLSTWVCTIGKRIAYTYYKRLKRTIEYTDKFYEVVDEVDEYSPKYDHVLVDQLVHQYFDRKVKQGYPDLSDYYLEYYSNPYDPANTYALLAEQLDLASSTIRTIFARCGLYVSKNYFKIMTKTEKVLDI